MIQEACDQKNFDLLVSILSIAKLKKDEAKDKEALFDAISSICSVLFWSLLCKEFDIAKKAIAAGAYYHKNWVFNIVRDNNAEAFSFLLENSESLGSNKSTIRSDCFSELLHQDASNIVKVLFADRAPTFYQLKLLAQYRKFTTLGEIFSSFKLKELIKSGILYSLGHAEIVEQDYLSVTSRNKPNSVLIVPSL